jgi:hypothetical protein
MISQVQRSAASGARIFGRVQPRVLEQAKGVLKVEAAQSACCQQRSTSAVVAPATEDHPQTGWIRVAGQVVDLQSDQGALGNWQLAEVVAPAASSIRAGATWLARLYA